MRSASLPSSPERGLPGRVLLILAAAALLSLAAHLLASALTYRIGFPLDDTWIHLTYARNLALRAEWAFLPGIPSAGSTAPLWTVLLVPGFFLPLAPYLWTFFLGLLCLWALALLAEWLLRRLLPAYRPTLPWGGLFFIFEWRLAWAAFSGMETSLYLLLILLAASLILVGSRRYLALGLLVGLAVWVRPDGLTLLGPLFLLVFFQESSWSVRWRGWLRLIIGFGALFLPYLFFNLFISGAPLPNTFYAKQAEYVSWQALPLVQRLGLFCLQFFFGPAVFLIPGFLLKLLRAFRQREAGVLLITTWMVGYVLLYLLRLPVYQHGRYYLPALVIFLALGLIGLIESLPVSRRYRTSWLRVAVVLLMFFVLAFGIYGLNTYGQEVAFIESQMVETARWMAENLPTGAIVAAHDIGALGYYDHHPLLDLAGLISPEVIPQINDDPRLSAYLTSRGVDYLVVFPGWRSRLVESALPVHAASGGFEALFGLGNLTVYRWP
jgi:hypothetical protein